MSSPPTSPSQTAPAVASAPARPAAATPPPAAVRATPAVSPRPTNSGATKPSVAAPRPTALGPLKTVRPAAPTPAPTPTPAPAPAAATKPLSPWAGFFHNWPPGIPQRGIVISQQGETTPFRGFMLRGELLLFERISPDSLGARFLVLSGDEVSGVKFTDPLKQEVFDEAGFTGRLSS